MVNNWNKSGSYLILVSTQLILNLLETLYWYAFQKFRHLIAKKKNSNTQIEKQQKLRH